MQDSQQPVTSNTHFKRLVFALSKGPLVWVWPKQNLCARKQNVSNGVSISLFGARM